MFVFDDHTNFGYALVTVAPAPTLTGTSLEIAAGFGSLFPTAPFNCTVWPAGVAPTAANAEIIRVTAKVGDVLTIVRAQEGSTAVAIAVGYQLANTTSVKVFTDLENYANTLPTFAIQSISAGTEAATGPQIIFANGNGVSFGMDANTLTASVGTAAGGIAISAGANSRSTGTVVFSNSNGITFGLSNNGVMTCSVINTGNMAVSAGTQSNDVGTMVFSNSNNVTFGMTNSSILTASVTVASTQGSVNFSAGTQSSLMASIVFSNSNGVSFGLSNGTITASASGGAGGGFTYDGFDPFQGFNIAAAPSGARSLKLFPLQFPSVQFDRAGLLCAFTNATNSTNTATVSVWIGLYSKNVSTLSFIGSASVSYSIIFSGTVNGSINNGIRLMTIPWTTTLAQSNYWLGVISLSTSGGASFSYYNASAAGSAFSGTFGAAAAGTEQLNLGLGWYSATATSFPASIAFSEINGTGNDNMRFPMVQFMNGTA